MPRFFDPAQREAPAEPSQGVGHTLQSGPATCESRARHPRLTVRPAAGQTVRTPHSDWSPSCGQGDPGWTPSRIQFGKTCGLTFLRRNAVEKIPWHGVLTCVQPRKRRWNTTPRWRRCLFRNLTYSIFQIADLARRSAPLAFGDAKWRWG